MNQNQKIAGAITGGYFGALSYIITTPETTSEGLLINTGIGALTGATISKKSTSTIVGIVTGSILYSLLTPKNKQNGRDLFASAIAGGLAGFATSHITEQLN